MRWDSPFVLVTAGTIAIHTILIVLVDAAVVTHPLPPPEPSRHVEYIKVEPKFVKPLPPVVQARTEPPPIKDTTPKPRVRTTQPVVREVQPPPLPSPAAPIPDSPQSGGDPVVSMPDIGPSATGVAVKVGKPNTGHVGRGGSGGGTGAGSGSGTGDLPPPTPVSIATIKTRALPKGDYGYFDAGKDYPAEARQLGIEGPIRVRLVVDDHGKVKAAVLLNRLGHGLDELALERAKKIEFEPAKDSDDKPVTSVVVWTFNMTLPK